MQCLIVVHSPVLSVRKIVLAGNNSHRSATLMISSIPNSRLSFTFTIYLSNVDAFNEIFTSVIPFILEIMRK